MAQAYDFGNLSPIEFEALVADLLGAELNVTFETFSEGADGGVDARHSSAEGDIIIQAKHYRGSTWADLVGAAKKEHSNIVKLNPRIYHFVTSQGLTPARKAVLHDHLNHHSVQEGNIRGSAEINALLVKHAGVEKRNIKLWLSSSAVLQRLLTHDIAVFTEAHGEGIRKVLKVFVENPSLPKAAEILNKQHCLIVSGPPGVGKTTLAQILAAEYCDTGWELVALANIEDGFRAFSPDTKQVFYFDDFLGTIKLEHSTLSRDDNRIAKFMGLIASRTNKRFILTTRKYILQAARQISEVLDSERVGLNEMVLDLRVYNREIKARILYNHLYHSGLGEGYIEALVDSNTIKDIVDHPHYMPRIIQWMTDHFRFEGVDPSDYPDRFMSALNNPDKIWEKPFRDISQEARIALYCIYFSEKGDLWGKGVEVGPLQRFFEQSLEAFSVPRDDSLPEARFSDAMRELKSSFVVFQNGKADFINPSVQDFLSRRVGDTSLLIKLASSVPTLSHLLALWKTVEATFKLEKTKKALVANVLLATLIKDRVIGETAFDRIASPLGEMMLLGEPEKFIAFLRSGGLADKVWINESELPSLIYDLIDGRFSALPHARGLGRMLRRSMYRFLSKREHVIEVEELGLLAENIEPYKDDYSEVFLDAFYEAAAESTDSLDLRGLKSTDDTESTVSEWLDQMEKIDEMLGYEVDWSKKHDLNRVLHDIHHAHEEMMAQHADEAGLRRSSSVALGSLPPVTPFKFSGSLRTGLSDGQLKSMFLSLKK